MITYRRVRNVKQPTRGSASNKFDRSAGIDFYVPERSPQFLEDLGKKNPDQDIFINSRNLNSLIVSPHSHILIPSGICCNLQQSGDFLYDENNALALIAFNKSSVASKKQLDVAATIVDEDYSGEIHISLTNTSPTPVEVFYGEKIVQFVLVPVLLTEWQEISDDEELFDKETNRGSNGFGSTGNF